MEKLVLSTNSGQSHTTISSKTMQGMETIEVTGPRYRARIALQGATLLDWWPRSVDGLEDESLVDGYRDLHELKSQNGVRNGILAPFTNRLTGGRFDFDGRVHELSPIAEGEDEVYHGFARVRLFALGQVDSDGDNLRIELIHKTADVGATGYPYDLRISVVYMFSAHEVELQIATTNLGQQRAPYAAGWHPYFRLPGTTAIDDLILQVPSRSVVETVDLIPKVASNGEVKLRDDDTFNEPERIGDRVLDCCFTNLVNERGTLRTILVDPGSGAELSVWQERGHMHVFTGDTLARDRRRSIALEPVEDLTNAFNLPGRIDHLLLDPGITRTFRCGFTYEEGERS
ncbi:aldose 1-epimerase [Agrobacterium vitis]|uniref:Aldose 1-epimerase n=1 Tax=Agrobacterium vitis TaxID=373 RepID=A0A368NGR0_AGRVI|nr:aldose 1-epimerase [Agrobacterium vitis]MCF1501935.1 aldose 1-epimerase [Allorhizobium sp. Av2]KAA3509295.1 aldose 1-epimerase [Agrobacterium vitis]KAA3522332.1 aldose 1-epimerase [Agrobacterium vitis]MCF1479511.1 aldose 1-epimerase [Agrobacterium vitis]MCM2443398.1 aldose 1-epimerase [Agrobacterium vitis]